MEKVLVTGASGYIGLHVIAQLIDRGYLVRGSLRYRDRDSEVRNAISKEVNTENKLEIYNKLINELRCLVCQNQSIAESNAPFAVDIKNIIKEKINNGESESQIKNFLVERYSDFILYDPPINLETIFLWFAPFIILTFLVLRVFFSKK